MGLGFTVGGGQGDSVIYEEGVDHTVGGGSWSQFVRFNNTPTTNPWFIIHGNTAQTAGSGLYFAGNNRLAFFVSGSTFMQRIESLSGALVTSFDGSTIYHLCWTWTGSATNSSVHIYVDNVEVTYDPGQDGSGLAAVGDRILIGGRDYTSNRTLPGDFWEPAYWDGIVLTAAERTRLFNRQSPRMVRPDKLLFHPPFVANAVPRSPIGGAPTVAGTSKVDHIRMIYPSSRRIMMPPAAVAVVENPWYYYAQQG